MNKKLQGDLYIIFASAAFGVMPILAKMAYGRGLTAYTVLFLRFFLAAGMLLYYIISKGYSLKITKKQMMITLCLGIFGYAGTSLFLFLAYNYISVGLATNIMFTHPAMIVVIAAIMFKEKMDWKKVTSLFLSIIGLFVLVGIKSSDVNFMGVILSLLSAVVYAAYIIGISNSEVKKINSYVFTFYISLTSSLMLLLVGISKNSINFNMDFYSLICVILLAFISTVIALMTFLKGVQLIGPSRASILSTIEPIVSVILGWLILHEAMTARMIVGSAMVVLSVLILVYEKKSESEQTLAQKLGRFLRKLIKKRK